MTRTHRPTGVALALVAAVIYMAGMSAAWLVGSHDYSETALLLRDVIPVLLVLVLVMAALAAWSGLTIHRTFGVGRFGMVALIPVVVILIGFAIAASSGVLDRGLLLTSLVGTALVGIGEEIAYRGIGLNALASRMSVPWAVAASSVLFGLLHATNVLVQPVGTTAIQIVMTTCIGLFLGWTYVLTGGNLVLVMVIHWLWDFALIGSQVTVQGVNPLGGPATLFVLGVAVATTIYGFVRLRTLSWSAPATEVSEAPVHG